MRIIICSLVKYTRSFLIQFKIDITISECRASIFSSDMTMIFYFNIIINIIIIADPTFNRVLKIFIVLCSHRKFFVKMLFHHVIAISTFFDHSINKIVNCIFTYVCLKRLTKLIISTYVFDICSYKTLLDFAFYYLLALKYSQNLHK